MGERAELAGDVGPDPRLIAVLAELDGRLDLTELRRQVAATLPALPVLSRRLVRTAGRRIHWRAGPVDVDDRVRVERITGSAPAAAAAILCRPLADEALWSLTLLTGPDTDLLLFVAHHVLLDGAGAARVFAALLGAEPEPVQPPPRRRRRPAVLGLLAGLGRGSSGTSLLVPIRSGFRLASVSVALAPVRAAARAAGATVNDVLLLVVSEALRDVAVARGESLRRICVSVPVTSPVQATGAGRNAVGAFVVTVPRSRPGEGDADTLGRIAARTRRRKALSAGSGAPPALSHLLVVLGRLGWYRALFSRQRAITTLLTNLRGPAQPIVVQGVTVTALTPISPALGNVTVVCAALSYAGRLRLTVRLDRSMWPDAVLLVEALRAALERIANSAAEVAVEADPAPASGFFGVRAD